MVCGSGCGSCSGVVTNCTGCLAGYYYNEGTCVTGCPSFMIVVDGVCRACIPPCLTCSNNNTLHCDSCVNGTYLLVTNTSRDCISACPSGYYQ